MFGIRDPQPVRSQETATWRERNNFSQSDAALNLQISKRTLQEWSKIELRRPALREPQLKKPFGPGGAYSWLLAEVVTIRESRISQQQPETLKAPVLKTLKEPVPSESNALCRSAPTRVSWGPMLSVNHV